MKGSHEMMKCRARATASKTKTGFVKDIFTEKLSMEGQKIAEQTELLRYLDNKRLITDP